MAGETLEGFEVAKGMVTLNRLFDNDHPSLHYSADPKVLGRVAETFEGRGNKGDAGIVRSAIRALAHNGGPNG